ncbi:MAG: type IIL restriction-modification enzyme MmeI, partial [Acetobacteraceae bacterium]
MVAVTGAAPHYGLPIIFDASLMPASPDVPTQAPDAIDAFIARWDGTELAERANKDMFLVELFAVLGVSPPAPASRGAGDYRFERAVTHHGADETTTPNFIDLYKRGSFVLEAKQGGNAHRRQASLFGNEAEHRTNVRGQPGWSTAMLKAKG